MVGEVFLSKKKFEPPKQQPKVNMMQNRLIKVTNLWDYAVERMLKQRPMDATNAWNADISHLR